MRKLSLLFCISLFSIAASYGQSNSIPTKIVRYCEIRYKFLDSVKDQSGKYPIEDGTEGIVIFDKNVNVKLFQDSIVVNKLGKLENVTICKSSIDAINYMSSIGWFLSNSVPLTRIYGSKKQSQGTWEIIFFFKKEFLVNAPVHVGKNVDMSSFF